MAPFTPLVVVSSKHPLSPFGDLDFSSPFLPELSEVSMARRLFDFFFVWSHLGRFRLLVAHSLLFSVADNGFPRGTTVFRQAGFFFFSAPLFLAMIIVLLSTVVWSFADLSRPFPSAFGSSCRLPPPHDHDNCYETPN